MKVTITELQRIATNGARAVELIELDGLRLLAIPQLAKDIPGQPPGMMGGDSNTDVLLLREVGGRYEPFSTLSAPGGEDAEFFTIGGQAFLALASIRRGSGPYEFSVESQIMTWQDGQFVPFQSVPTFAAKQWKHWRIGQRHFLGLAQGTILPGFEDQNRASMIYEWNGSSFVEFQAIPSRWAYNWHAFEIEGTTYLAHADHVDPSMLYRWNGESFVVHQQLAERAGRAFTSFTRDGDLYLVVACLEDVSRLLRWNGTTFVDVQELDGLGAREVTVFEDDGQLFVVRINMILGNRSEPRPEVASQIYAFDEGQLVSVAEFETTGGTDAVVSKVGDDYRMVVSNSLASDVRFASATVLYSLTIDR
ncbi:hypothetical protein BWI15_00095 [Kribbella sp. ALI-6-A]|uniref:hypothetical protein n=1 Tax=Kribbella sp. ALI-6-A TaxID=1933817 RepID=UPI00097CB8D6|nr:hypothetical protein [Kribbella sp. ALI-6-A]ONI79083.1 hypothetical protein BWI15_00095 [Kribbella sp. ALI-6-A]